MIRPAPIEAGTVHARHLYTILVKTEELARTRDWVLNELLRLKIGTGVHFPIPIHLQPATRDLGYRAGDLPHTEQAAREVLSIPMYPELSSDQQEWVAASITSAPAHVTTSRSKVPQS